MKVRQVLLTAAISLAGAASCCSCDKEPAEPAHSVTLGKKTWSVKLAMDDKQRYQGLSDVLKLPEGTGMLFIYPRPQVLDFCMRNCYIPLDIAFLDANGIVVKTYTMEVEPRGHEVADYSSVEPAQYALEMNKGELKAAGVKEGDQAKFTSIPDPAKAEEGR